MFQLPVEQLQRGDSSIQTWGRRLAALGERSNRTAGMRQTHSVVFVEITVIGTCRKCKGTASYVDLLTMMHDNTRPGFDDLLFFAYQLNR